MKGKTRGNRTKKLVARNEGMVVIEIIFRFASIDTVQNILSSPYIFSVTASSQHTIVIQSF